MHPLFRKWRRFLLYVAAWIELGVILGVLAPASSHVSRLEAIAIMVPLMMLLGFVCLAPHYLCRSIPLRAVAWRSLLQHHLAGTVVATACVMMAGRLLAGALSTAWPDLDQMFAHAAPVLTVFVTLTYMLSTALHYAFLEVESSRRAEVLAREAQLRALKAQINPHFLFNSLNSISALTSMDPARAREMCIGLADFLRASLRLGERDVVPFGEEMALTDMYLGVEQARFGERLRVVRDIEPGCEVCEVPALLIQPLVENAIKHGIAMMVEGGEISISGRRGRDEVRFSVANPCDPDAPMQERNGIGLRNVRERLAARYGSAAKMHVEAAETSYRVTLTLPENIMKTFRAIIADDEELARRVLREYLDGEPDIEIIAECPNGFEAVKAVNELKPDVLFLDVQMPKLDGFEVLELVEPSVAVVFVTAFDQYAMKAFDAAAVDYLLKPFNTTRFRASIDRIRARFQAETPAAETPRDLKMAARAPGDFLERLVVKDGPRVHVIPVAKLDSAEAQDDYVGLRSEGKTWLKQQTISSLEATLDPRRFLRAHRSFLVNMERIARVEPNTKDTWIAVLRDGSKIPMSRAGYTRFRELAEGH